MRGKITSGAVMTSLVLHVVIALVAGLYLLTRTEQFRDLMGIEIFQSKELPKPKVGRFIMKPTLKPTVPIRDTPLEQMRVQPRVVPLFVRDPMSRSRKILEFSPKPLKVKPPTYRNVPKRIAVDPVVPTDGIHVDLLVSDAPAVLALSAPVVTVSSARPRTAFRGLVGHLKVTLERPPGLAMVEHVGATHDVLGDVVENITLSRYVVPPLPKGEPGGRVVGKGKDIRGVFRFVRVRHELSDWWSDASALNALTRWLNERTHIKTDMNVEGGAVKLNDANLYKTPLAFMTGHDPALVRSRQLFGGRHGTGKWRHGTGKIDGRLTEPEAAGLRRYLIEKGGFLVFDDCGVNAPTQAMTRLFLSQMRYVMPEYHIERIANTHEVYNNFYVMGGPPVGYDIFWWGTRPPRRNFLEGISIGEKLAVIVSRRDYMCAMETVSLPTRSVHYSPAVYRFMTNVVMYALTHGSISDYSGYVPESVLIGKALPMRPPAAAKIGDFK